MLKITATISFFFITFNSQAFILLDRDYKLSNPTNVMVHIASGGCGTNIPNGELNGYLQETLDDYWNTVPESLLFMELGGESDIAVTENPPAGKIIVGCASLGAGVGGVASINTEKNGCRVRLNSDELVPGNYTKEIIMAIIIHEIGHCVGLHHSNDTASVMTYNDKSYIQPQHLSRDDKDGVVYLYPYEKKASLFGGCSAIASEGNLVSQPFDLAFLFLFFPFFIRLFFRKRA